MQFLKYSPVTQKASLLIGMGDLRAKLGGDSPPDVSTIYRMIQQGILPKPVKISARMSRWIEAEVDEAIQRRAEARAGPGARWCAQSVARPKTHVARAASADREPKRASRASHQLTGSARARKPRNDLHE